jgi:hypothetical protein
VRRGWCYNSDRSLGKARLSITSFSGLSPFAGTHRNGRNAPLAGAHDLKHGCAGSPARYDCAVLQVLRAEDALAIAEAARRRSRDEQAMAQYLGLGRGSTCAKGPLLDGTLLRCPEAVDLAAFESEEGQRLENAIAQLSPDAQRELIALIWLAQRPLLSFEAALRRTRRIPPAAQPGYLLGIRLERYIADGLRRLGCPGS